MKKQLLSFALFAAGMLYAMVLHAESVYYVQSVNARIWIGTSFVSKVIGEVGKGQMLVSTGREGRWVKVKYNGKEGYVPFLLLSTHPPIKRTEIIKAEDSDIKQGVRRRASSFTVAAAARGLTKETRERGEIDEGANFNALNKMESLAITDEEITQFIEGGKL